MNFILYYAAVSADAIFQAELVRAYGKRATEYRYATWNICEPVNIARRQKYAADDAWISYMKDAK